MLIEGKLLQLTIEPGEQHVVGVTVLTKDGEEEGRAMRRPEQTYGSIKFDGTPIPTLAHLIEKIAEGECTVKWASELTVSFTKDKDQQ